ncbi:uncharacterized protein im:7136021 isoform X1 [Gadus chalcogrammus]|uniref:uncharacterized protein im:7136021 isoform X1 n=1 Tax=Gadus chalcogrammus TaxID=1042646 RepID=UPI0024C30948|nr:uncharacterized protein im:7136021 isoform X1 [Gadus chalcogrammus]
MPLKEYSLPEEVWIHAFTFLSTRDKHSVRATCRYFREVLDKNVYLWKDFSVVLNDFSRYNRGFWRTLARRNVRTLVLREGKKKYLRPLPDALPSVTGVALDYWSEPQPLDTLARFSKLTSLSFHNSQCPLDLCPLLQLLSLQVTRLSVCNVKLRSPTVQFISTVSKMRNLTQLLHHHDGTERIPLRAFHDLLSGLPRLQHLSWEMVAHRSLPDNFFSPPSVQQQLEGPRPLPLSSLELLNYDTLVTRAALAPLAGLRRLSVLHLYSVPGPQCHLCTWLLALPRLTHLSVHGGHRLGAWADCLPQSVVGLTLCVDLTLDDLVVLGARLPQLQHLHLEPWGATGYVALVPELFPQLRTLKIRHHNVPESDFLGLALLDKLHHLEVLDWYCGHRRPAEGHTHIRQAGGHASTSPRLSNLIAQLRHLTNNRVHITPKRQQDPLLCQCLS